MDQGVEPEKQETHHSPNSATAVHLNKLMDNQVDSDFTYDS